MTLPDPARLGRVLPLLTDEERRDVDGILASWKPKPQFLDPTFREQSAFISDPAKLKAIIAPRRSGKSFGEARYLFREAYEHPGVSVVYVGLTRDSAKRIMWKDALEPVAASLGLDVKQNLTDLSMTLPNRSVVYLIGLDSNEKEKRKVFGQKFRLAVIDEAALYTIDLRELVYKVLKPAMIDHDGTIVLSGMPSNLKKGLFFDITNGLDASQPGVVERLDVLHGARWSVHRWSAWQNPYIAGKWDAEVAEMKAINPRIEETPIFQQEYLGRWVTDDSKLVYRYQQHRNDFGGALPEYERGRWHHVLACDLGYNDPTSLTVLAYHDHDPHTYVRRSEKRPGLDVTAVAEWAKAWTGEYEFDEFVIDNANKQAVEEMVRRHQIPWQAADKSGKADFIEIMNGDFIAGRILVDPVRCAPLLEEWSGLVWDDKSAKREEHPACPNHCADGALYGWRKLYGYLSTRHVTAPAVGSGAWVQQQAAEMEAAAQAAWEARQRESEESW